MHTMSTWTSDELDSIGSAEELEIASVRDDGTRRKPVTVWVVRHGDDLYVRSVNGRTSPWFRRAQAHHEAHINAAYRTKYHRYAESIVDSIVSPSARAATLKLVPR
jgi:hypothetical protein